MTGTDITLDSLSRMMSRNGVDRLYIKFLSPNDNSKNQIYLGPDFSALNILPHKGVVTDSDIVGWKRARFKAALDLAWLNYQGGSEPAPTAQMVLYPRYPEIRLSGFLKGCRAAPSELLASRRPDRILVLGVAASGQIYGYVTILETALGRELASKKSSLPQSGVFLELTLAAEEDSKKAILRALKSIHEKGWIDSKRLDGNRNVTECNSPQCGGYTLEAELGITPNGKAEPDYLGWEVKQHAVKSWAGFNSGNPLTLMTPEPSAGFYKEKGVEAFLRRFGYPDKCGREDRINFGGVYRIGTRVESTGLTLTFDGYDAKKGKITKTDGGLCLLDDHGELAAKWMLVDLMRHWNRKHAKAVYVPAMRRTEPQRQYCYGADVKVCEGTDFMFLLKAMHESVVYYDPAVKLENASTKDAKTKRRSQFRIHPADISSLYNKSSVVNLEA